MSERLFTARTLQVRELIDFGFDIEGEILVAQEAALIMATGTSISYDAREALRKGLQDAVNKMLAHRDSNMGGT